MDRRRGRLARACSARDVAGFAKAVALLSLWIILAADGLPQEAVAARLAIGARPAILTGAGPGAGPHVRVIDTATGAEVAGFLVYDPAFRGGVDVASCDITGDGVTDVITGAGPGGAPHVRVFDGLTGAAVMGFLAYDPAFRGGVHVACGDVNGDGVPDIITGPGAGGGPHVRVFSGADGRELMSFLAYSPGFSGGVFVAAGDVNGDGHADIVTGAGPGGGPQVRVFDGATEAELASFFAYHPGFAGGVRVAAGDIDGDGRADLIVGTGPGGGPHVRVFSGVDGHELLSFFAYDPGFGGGLWVAAGDVDGDGRADVITGVGPGGGPHVRAFSGVDGHALLSFFAYDPGFPGGVAVGSVAVERAAPIIAFTPPTPAEGSLINRATPPLGLTYADVGAGADPATLELRANGAVLAATCTPGADGATCTLTTGLPEGLLTLTATIRDRAGNRSAAARVRFMVDTVAPGAVRFLTVGAVAGGQVTINGGAGSVEAGTRVTIRNARTGQTVTVVANADGSFAATIGSQAGDVLSVTVTDAAGNTGPATQVAASGGLPPDPTTVAPALDAGGVTNLAAATAFLYTGPNPIQTGVAAGTIEPVRVAVLRGRVLTRAGAPLPAVTVSVLGHPEFGQTLTRADGLFDLAVNGGGVLNVRYDKAGFLPAQRQLTTPWRDYVWLPEVALIPVDTEVTTIDLTAATPMQVARGSAVTDADGTRQATLLIPQGTMATMILPDGTSRALTTLNVRATEYTVGPNGPAAMPGELPPTSGYTYAVELSADEALAAGASTVLFSQPLIHYVENFLDFPVGGIVPVGYYDRQKAAWVPSDNGRVIRIVSIAGDLAELDTDADPAVDNGVGLGITEAERRRLALLYRPGQSLWRVPITHFTPWDCNWPYGPPPDAEAPRQPDPRRTDLDDPCKQSGSIIACENQALGEALALTGTPFRLHYQSDRVPGRKADYTLGIPLSGPTVPASLRSIALEVHVAGRVYEQSFPAAPDQVATFTWDGMDAYGRTLAGRQPVTARIGYLYPAVYLGSSTAAAFARFGDSVTGNLARQEITIWQEVTVHLGAWDARGQGLGGWSLNIHHVYDVNGRVLLLGDGSRRSGAGILAGQVITTTIVAPPTLMSAAGGVAVGPDGSLYVGEGFVPFTSSRIVRVGPDGTQTIVVDGNVPEPECPARAHALDPGDLALAPDGSLYVTGNAGVDFAVYRVAPDGTVTRVAGRPCGLSGDYGDGGPATEAAFEAPANIALGPDQSLYIADYLTSRVRRVGADGIITTVAGQGTCGFGGDGGPARLALLCQPWGLAVGADGSLYIADRGNQRIRRVAPDGRISTIAGNGTAGYSGDGGPATAAQLNEPLRIALAPAGGLYFSDSGNNVVRRIHADGVILTVAGTGQNGFSGDGGPARAARLSGPSSLGVAPGGRLYVNDAGTRIRQVEPPLPTFGFGEADIVIPSEEGNRVYVFQHPTGRHERTFHALTGAVLHRFAYDSRGLLASVTNGDGNVTTIERDGRGNPTAIVSPFGQRTILATDTNGYLSSLTNPAGELVQVAYTADGLLTSFTDPRGNTSSYTYDGSGRLIRADDPAGGFKALTRSETANGSTVAVRTALGRATRYSVERLPDATIHRTVTDPSGARTETVTGPDGKSVTTYPDGTTVTVESGPDPRFGMLAPLPKRRTITTPTGLTGTITFERAVELVDPHNPLSLTTQTDTLTIDGRTFTTSYDGATRTLSSTSPAGRTRTITLDAKGRVVRDQLGGLEPTISVYDARGRLSAVTQGTGPGARTSSLSYGPDGFLAGLTDPLGRSISFTNDAGGRPISKTLPGGRTVGFAYDPQGNVTGLIPPGRSAHGLTYTAVDLVSSYAPPDLGVGSTATSYTYDLDRALQRELRPDGQAVDLAYDSVGRLTTLGLARGTVGYAYDAADRLAGITAPGGLALAYTYEGYFLTGETASGAVAGSVTRTYDSSLRVASRSVNGSAVGFAYDDDDLLTQAGALNLTHAPNHGLVTDTSLGAVTTSLAYTGFGEPSRLSAAAGATPLYDTQYTQDSLGRITRKVETIGGATATNEYAYDAAGRLVEVRTNGAVVESYTYDANGNRVGATVGGVTSSASYDAQDRLTQYGSTTYTYTANGELAARTAGGQTTSYDYDEVGNLIRVGLPSGTQIEYLVDGRNRRVGKKVDGVLVQGFLYGGGLRPVAELDASNTVVSRFVYAGGQTVPAYMLKGGATYRLITDHVGSVRLVVNTSTGNVAQRLDYDGFGNVTLDTSPGFQPFGFAGGLYDEDTGLLRFGARDYDARTGRWTAKDPIRFIGGDVNLYAYVRNDPVNRYDPSGRFDVFGFGSVSGGPPGPMGMAVIPIAGYNELETIVIGGYNSEEGFFVADIFARGIKLGGEQNYVATFGGREIEVGAVESKPIIIVEGSVGAELPFIGGGGVFAGAYEVGLPPCTEKGVFFGVSGGALGAHASLGIGFSLPHFYDLLYSAGLRAGLWFFGSN